MNIDIQSISQALAAAGTAVRVLRQARDLLPDGSEKQQVDEAIQI